MGTPSNLKRLIAIILFNTTKYLQHKLLIEYIEQDNMHINTFNHKIRNIKKIFSGLKVLDICKQDQFLV